jgi:hypothetical protein
MSTDPEEKRTGRIIKNPEILAMDTIAETLDELDERTRGVVVRWAKDRYDCQSPPNCEPQQ